MTDSVWHLSHHSAGICVRFATDATAIWARWKLAEKGTVGAEELWMNHMAAAGVSGLDLYLWDDELVWRWVGVGRPTGRENCTELVAGLREGMKGYRLYLPLYNAVESVQIGVARGATLQARRRQPIKPPPRVVYYGTSITQGGCASRPGMAYTSIVGRRVENELGCEVETINLGFSGSGRAEIEMADFVGEIDATVYVIDCMGNVGSPEEIARVEPFVRRVRQLRPQKAMVLAELAYFTHSSHVDKVYREIKAKNMYLRDLYERLTAEGWKKLYYVEGTNLFGSDGEATVDGVHPTDLGFSRMAEIFAPIVQRAITE